MKVMTTNMTMMMTVQKYTQYFLYRLNALETERITTPVDVLTLK